MKSTYITLGIISGVLSACDGTNFIGKSESGAPGPSAAGDAQGIGDGLGPDGAGDYEGVGTDEETEQVLQALEESSSRKIDEVTKRGWSSGADSDKGAGNACHFFNLATTKEQKTMKIPLRSGGTTPVDVNVGDLAITCVPKGDNCEFEFSIYIECSGFPCTQDKFVGYNLSMPARETGHIASVYSGSIENFRSESCSVIAGNSPRYTKRSLDGCFAPETKITTAQGEQKISELDIGALVLNPLSGKYLPVAEITVGVEEKPLIELGYDAKTVQVTSEHPFMTERGLKQAQEITKLDRIVTATGSFAQVQTLKVLAPKDQQTVYNIRLLASHEREQGAQYVQANGIVTGDLGLQRDLAEQRRNDSMSSLFSQPLALFLELGSK
jgi:hypothetical protein